MSELLHTLGDEELTNVVGGMSHELQAAYACIRGDYGNGDARFAALKKAGFDPQTVQSLVNSLLKYENVARDVINGAYGNGDARKAALLKAGYPYDVVQNLVNHMLR